MQNLYESLESLKKNNNFEPLYNLYINQVKNICKKYHIDDQYNSIMLRLWKIGLTIKLCDFESEYKLNAYINRCLKNCAINLYRKENLNTRTLYNTNTTYFELDKQSSMTLSDISSELIFYDTIKNLTPKQKEIITLKYKDGLSDEQISEKLLITRQAVHKSRVSALMKLKNTYENILNI